MPELGQSRHLTVRRLLPIFPYEQTSVASVGMSQTCQHPTSAFQFAGGPGVQVHAGFWFPVPLSARVNSRTSFNSSSPSTSDTTRSAPTLLTTGTAKFINLRSSDDRESGRSAAPSGTSTVSRKD